MQLILLTFFPSLCLSLFLLNEIMSGRIEESDNTDNSVANLIALPAFGLLVSLLGFYQIVAPFGLVEALIFQVSYLFASLWFGPDLDVGELGDRNQRGRRPFQGPLQRNITGKHSFPLGHIMKFLGWAGLYRLKDVANLIHIPFNHFWRFLWFPYSFLLTHRGISHWVVVGTALRVSYVTIVISIPFYLVTLAFGLPPVFPTEALEGVFYFLLSPLGLPALMGLIFSDFSHTTIDFIDSRRKGYSFCPPGISRGYIASLFEGRKIGRDTQGFEGNSRRVNGLFRRGRQ